MDLSAENFAEARGKSVHFVGIGGVGMSALAVLLKNRGFAVSGCDVREGARLGWLRSQGISVSVGHDAAHVALSDAVIVTPAVSRDNPERAAAAARGLLKLRGEVLATLVSEAPDSVAVCGSHGKTTTATWIAKLLLALGESVEWAIGGETGAFPVAGRGNRPPASPVLVVEADESDGTLALYRAKTLVVTNCDWDHPDHFPTEASYRACYEAARAKAGETVEGGGSVLSPEDAARFEPLLADLAPHNRQNARMAVAVALRRGHVAEKIAAALPAVVSALPDRRFQLLRRDARGAVYTDYAHHPTEMACAVAMARRICRGTLRVLFQPHRYSRTKALLGKFPASFAGADEVTICPVYAAFEKPLEGGTSEDLHAACLAARVPGVRFRRTRSCAEAWALAEPAMREGDVTLILGAGDIIALASAVRP